MPAKWKRCVSKLGGTKKAYRICSPLRGKHRSKKKGGK